VIRNSLVVCLGAIAGALSRYYLTLWFSQFSPQGSFPYSTFAINLSGCVAIGFFTAIADLKFPDLPPEIRLLVITGFLGAYTTFSTYGLETVNLFSDRGMVTAGSYWLGSALLGVVGVKLGVNLALWVI
jgi:fluoride exporter